MRLLAAAATLAAVLLAPGGAAAARPATVIFHHGTVLTMDAARPRASALAVRGSRIVRVGSNRAVLALRGPGTRVVNLRGRTLMPGFVDAHSHVLWESLQQGLTLVQGQETVLRNGITARGEMFVPPELVGEVEAFAAAGDLHVRTSLYPLATDNCGAVQAPWYAEHEPVSAPGRMLRIPGVKVFTDGGSCGRPAVSWVYPNRGGGSGDLWLAQDVLDRIVREADARGFQVAIHALGDRAIDQALTAIAHVLGGRPNTLRHRIEHNALVRPDQIRRYGQLGVVATLFGAFGTCAFGDGGFARGDLAPGTEPYLWPWRELVDASPGARFAWHSDSPVLSLDPFASLYGFVTRRQLADDGSICRPEPEQANDTLPRGTALELMTLGAAYALGQDSVLGSLEPGKLADLIVVSGNPLSVGADAIPRLAVLATIVGGKTRYCAPAAGGLCP